MAKKKETPEQKQDRKLRARLEASRSDPAIQALLDAMLASPKVQAAFRELNELAAQRGLPQFDIS